MTNPGDRPRDAGGERPPKRLLDQAPSERLTGAPGTAAVAGASDGLAAGTAGRALGYGIAAAAVGVALHVGAATLLLWTSGLLVVATTIGIAVGLAVAAGAGGSLRPWPRRGLAIALALVAIGFAAGLSWALSGRYLDPLDYLAQVYGLLVPAQLALAAVGALAGAR